MDASRSVVRARTRQMDENNSSRGTIGALSAGGYDRASPIGLLLPLKVGLIIHALRTAKLTGKWQD